MADTKTPGVGKRQTLDLSKINPLIGQNGDTVANVQGVLGFLSFLLVAATESTSSGSSRLDPRAIGSVHLSYDHARALATVLDTCGAALSHETGEVSA